METVCVQTRDTPLWLTWGHTPCAGSVSVPAEHKLLVIGPTEPWSVREKLCLATSVMTSGDQNWYRFIVVDVVSGLCRCSSSSTLTPQGLRQ